MYGGTELKPGKSQLQRHHCPSFWWQVSFQAPLSCSFPLSLSALRVPCPSDVTTPTHCADRRTLACVRAIRPNPPKPPSLRACNQQEYQAIVVSLLYLSTKTRPDIAYAVSNVACFCARPTKQHWVALKRILRYLKGTVNYGLVYLESDKNHRYYTRNVYNIYVKMH